MISVIAEHTRHELIFIGFSLRVGIRLLCVHRVLLDQCTVAQFEALLPWNLDPAHITALATRAKRSSSAA